MNKIKLGILNSSPILDSYGGVGPFIKNLDPFLSKDLEVTYITLPPHLHDIKYFPRRLTYFTFLMFRFRSFRKYDMVLSHVPEGSYILSYSKTPLAHIFHGNHNPMSQSRFWYGKYFKSIFKTFEKRIIKKAKLKYTVGNERPDIPKIMNPIYHNVAVKPKETRSGFIFVGRLEKIKNIDKIIQIYSMLAEEIRKENRLFIAGKGSQDQYLKQLVDKLNLTERVVFTGEIINDQLIELVSHKKMLLMASSQEGLPMAIAESLSVGIPVISTDTGDISRVIKNNYNGFLLPIEFDQNIYAEKITTVLKNYAFYAENALESAEIFKAENVAKNLIYDIQTALN
jgi:glycosyltransferase involved in cell wall biosynthesis